jgi:hypothetical protein
VGRSRGHQYDPFTFFFDFIDDIFVDIYAENKKNFVKDLGTAAHELDSEANK